MTWKNTLRIATTVMAGVTAIPGIALAVPGGYHDTLPAGGSGYYGLAPDVTDGHANGSPADRELSIGGSARALLDQMVLLDDTAPSWATPAAKVAEAAPGQKQQVNIALALRDPRGAQEFAEAVSTPGNPRRGEFLTNREFTERFGPSRRTVDKVSRWLEAAGTRVTGVSANRSLMTVEGTNAQLEEAFNVELALYRTPGGTRVTLAPNRDLAVPTTLRGAVNGILGLGEPSLVRPLHTGLATQPTANDDTSSSPRRNPNPAAAGDGCARWWGEQNNTDVPQKYPTGRQSNVLCGYNTRQIRGMHSLSATHTGRGQTVGIVGAYNLDTIESDTNQAAAQYGSPPLTPGQYSSSLPQKFENQDECAPQLWAVEQAMDVQASHTAAPGAKLRYYGARSCYLGHMFAALNRAVEANQVDVVSNSWGYADEAEQPAAAHKQFGQIAVQAAAQGQTVLVSSGDSGDASGHAGRKQVSFPAASPWVTAAGGTSTGLDANGRTTFTTGWANAGNTLANGRWVPQKDKDGPFAGGAGGGRATHYAQPSYQKGVVPEAIAKGKRTLPDIASLADSYTGFGMGMTQDGQFALGSTGGTSLAAPLLAGIVANAAQTNDGQRIGFLNPALYGMRGDESLIDIKAVKAGVVTNRMTPLAGVTVPGGEGTYLVDAGGKPQSLAAGTGWDPLTGVGAPARGFIDRLTR